MKGVLVLFLLLLIPVDSSAFTGPCSEYEQETERQCLEYCEQFAPSRRIPSCGSNCFLDRPTLNEKILAQFEDLLESPVVVESITWGTGAPGYGEDSYLGNRYIRDLLIRLN